MGSLDSFSQSNIIMNKSYYIQSQKPLIVPADYTAGNEITRQYVL